MNRTALASLADSDVNVFVIEALRFTPEDERALERLKAAGRPMILLVNKVDRARPRERLLPFVADVSAKAEFAEVLLVSARRSDGIDRLPELIASYLPESPLLYPPDQLTDVSERFMAAEIVREKLTLRLQDELPYGLFVEIENMGPLGRAREAARAGRDLGRAHRSESHRDRQGRRTAQGDRPCSHASSSSSTSGSRSISSSGSRSRKTGPTAKRRSGSFGYDT